MERLLTYNDEYGICPKCGTKHRYDDTLFECVRCGRSIVLPHPEWGYSELDELIVTHMFNNCYKDYTAYNKDMRMKYIERVS